MNIIDLIKNQLTGGTLDKLSSALGESGERTQSAVGAAVPTLLAGMTHVASTPEGAHQLFSAISDHEAASGLETFGTALSSQGSALANRGSSALSSLFGEGTLSSISSTLGGFTGMGGAKTGTLLGMLSPLIFGVLGHHQRAARLDASGLSSFLNSQKQNVASAMPAGLGKMLGGIPGVGSFAKTEPEPVPATSAASYDEPSTRKEHREFVSAGTEYRGGGKWIAALVIVLLLVGAFWSYTYRQRGTARPQLRINEPAGSALPPVAISRGVTDALGNAEETLNGITDVSSAEKAIPQLDQINSRLTDMQPSWNRMPMSAKMNISSSIRDPSTKLRRQMNRLRNNRGVSEKLKPQLDALDSHLLAFGQ